MSAAKAAQHTTPRLVIIAAGDGGTTAEAFIHASQAGLVNGVVTDVIYNNPITPENSNNHIATRIRRLNKQYATYGKHPGVIAMHLISNATHPGGLIHQTMISDEASEAMCKVLDDTHAALGLLLGFRKMIRGKLLTRYADKGFLTNNHPGRVDIPELRGIWGNAVHQRAYELRQADALKETGFTIQLVHPEYDMGTVLEMVPVPISLSDTPQDIRENVQTIEKIYTPKIINNYLKHLQML
ncbi:MAG: phosphoribosylglycinamide formyltransferase [Candidatus Saccharibacteria bacterium]|nr:phosphoribosylglycinamide formyltransferase [Candidatus Saccharibacteria bacterium]